MKIPNEGSTIKQQGYARDVFSNNGRNKKEIALNNGYSLNAANSVASKIENTKGYKNAMVDILRESDNVVLNIFAEFKSRGFKEFSNKDLINAVTAISTAWEKFNGKNTGDNGLQSPNKLRNIILQHVENQTIQQNTPSKIVEVEPIIEVPQEPENVNEYPGF